MKLRSLFAGAIACIAVVACSHLPHLESAPSFKDRLGKQYTNLAINDETSSYKWLNTEYFANKGKRAYKGVDVQPEDPETWNVPREYKPELNNAYDMLQIALVPDQKKVTAPVAAADAQAYFDCWVEQTHKRWTPTAKSNDCRAAFYEAFCRMYSGRLCGPGINKDSIFRVYFETGRSNVKVAGRKAVADAAAAYAKGANEVIVAGHADRVGNAEANLKLSKARAAAVRAQLIHAGIPAEKINEKYFGEKVPLVPTSDNVPNANNRRVLIVVR